MATAGISQLAEHKCIDRRADPVGIRDCGDLRPADRLKRPVIDRGRLLCRDKLFRGVRPWRSQANPRLEGGDLRVGQLRTGRGHLQIAGSPDRLDEPALFRVTGNNDAAVLASFEQELAGIDPQLAGLVLLAVAFETAFDQNRPDVRFEELNCGCV